MKKAFLISLLSVAIVGCTTASNVTKFNSNVKGSVYNSIASRYTDMLTTALLSDYENGDKSITYSVETYKMNQFGARQTVNLTVPSYAIDEHAALLNKFLEWDGKAKNRGDQFTKEIGRAKTVNGYSVYTFHSGNQHSNLLDICFVLSESMPCTIESVTFDVRNVKLILQDLDKFKKGDVKKVDTSIYQ